MNLWQSKCLPYTQQACGSSPDLDIKIPTRQSAQADKGGGGLLQSVVENKKIYTYMSFSINDSHV